MKPSIPSSPSPGKGPAILQAILRILHAAGVRLDPKTAQTLLKIGKNQENHSLLGLYVKIHTKLPTGDLVLVQENEEDLFTGMEYQQTPNVCHGERIISRMACERTIRYAFEFAKKNGRKEVACFTKDSLLKHTDGLFHHVFDEIAFHYPEILNEHWPLELGAAKLIEAPEDFDVIVLPNYSGEILAVQIGASCTASIGENHAFFASTEEDLFNATLAAVQMLTYLDQTAVADRIYNALLKAFEEEIHKKELEIDASAEAIIQRLGKTPQFLEPKKIAILHSPAPIPRSAPPLSRRLVGVDATIYHKGPLSLFFPQISHITIGPLRLKKIMNRGERVWPQGTTEAFCIEQWVCRFTTEEGRATSQDDIIKVLHAFDHVGIEVIKAEFLYTFSGSPGF